MQNIEIKNWRKHPEIKAIVLAAFPDYRKTKVWVYIRDAVTLTDLNWSGGTRSEYKAVRLTSAKVEGDLAAYNAIAPWDERQIEGKTVDIPPGMCVVRSGHFCGQVSTATIYVRPSDVTPQLTAN